MKNIIFAFILALTSCGHSDTEDKRTTSGQPTPSDQITDLKNQVLYLQGIIAQVTSFVSSDYTTCNNNLAPFTQKICQIAQTATGEQQTIFVGQIEQTLKIFQTELYGVECINTTDPGCPVAGSITNRLTTAEASITSINSSISTINTNITALQSSITTLQTNMTAVQARLNNFNGSGSSIETVVAGLQTSITTLNSQVATIQSTLATGSIYRTFLLCGNIAASGPAYEPILVTGDNTKVVAYIVSGTSNGMGIEAQAGVTGTLYLSTFANTSTCKFKIYDRSTTVKVCWMNTNKSATAAQIDTACNSPTFASPAASCTCAN